jgi:hypothetical protein
LHELPRVGWLLIRLDLVVVFLAERQLGDGDAARDEAALAVDGFDAIATLGSSTCAAKSSKLAASGSSIGRPVSASKMTLGRPAFFASLRTRHATACGGTSSGSPFASKASG